MVGAELHPPSGRRKKRDWSQQIGSALNAKEQVGLTRKPYATFSSSFHNSISLAMKFISFRSLSPFVLDINLDVKYECEKMLLVAWVMVKSLIDLTTGLGFETYFFKCTLT